MSIMSEHRVVELQAEIERLRLSAQQWEADALRYCQNASDARNLAIEECARVAEGIGWWSMNKSEAVTALAAAIRALKEKP